MLQTKGAEKIKTLILFSVTYFFENHSVYEIKYKNTEKLYRSQTTIWRTCCACYITKSTNINSEYVIIITFPQQRSLGERALALRTTLHVL
jgi:hypothetical protein